MKTGKENQINVLVVGNNPTELGHVYDDLQNVPDQNITTEIAFDLQSIFERLAKFRPTYILIDDNIGRSEVKVAVQALLKSRKTRSIPITILKNSNYHEAVTSGALNYVLKAGLTGTRLYYELTNSLRLRTTQQYLMEAWKKRKRQMLRLLK